MTIEDPIAASAQQADDDKPQDDQTAPDQVPEDETATGDDQEATE